MTEEEIEDLLEIGCCHYHMEVGEKANKEIKRLNNIIQALKQTKLYCVDYETEEDIKENRKIYIPFNLESFIKSILGSDKE